MIDSGYHTLMQPLLVKEQKLSSELEAVRAAIANLRTAAEADVPTGPAFSEKPTSRMQGFPLYDGMSPPDMVYETIKWARRNLVSREIVEIWHDNGFSELGDESAVKVQHALNRRGQGAGDVIHVGDGKWGLSEWYTSSEIAEMPDKIDGANARDRKEHSKRTKEGVAAYKARGGSMGQPHFVKGYPKRLARFRELWPIISDAGMTGKEVLRELNKSDPDAPKINSVQAYFNWKNGNKKNSFVKFAGFDPDTPVDAGIANKIRIVK